MWGAWRGLSVAGGVCAKSAEHPVYLFAALLHLLALLLLAVLHMHIPFFCAYHQPAGPMIRTTHLESTRHLKRAPPGQAPRPGGPTSPLFLQLRTLAPLIFPALTIARRTMAEGVRGPAPVGWLGDQ